MIGFFMSVLPSFEYHFNSILLTFITGVCSEIPCSIVLHFAETSYLNFIKIQLTGCCIMQDLGVGNFGTDYKQFCILPFFCLLALYFYIALLKVFLEYVPCKPFRYLFTLIGLLTYV